MKGLDTNGLVRLLVDDDPEQADRAEAFIRREHAAGSRCYVNKIVLCELVWVLERTYGYPRADVANALERLLHTAPLRLEGREDVRAAVRTYRDGRSDFADHLIGATNRNAGCTRTATFDRKATRLDTFEAL
ncbi:MAG TPA: type II toxin-antitoxin system VapC family toxin [Gemmatimonadales bacterium]|nr:type II toxin-antitoxin system VapC family toxin [Gemmatimonadales bacterium]